MLKKDVKIGGRYVTTISGKRTVVRINNEITVSTSRSSRTQWVGTNEATGREVRIKSAAKLRAEAKPKV